MVVNDLFLVKPMASFTGFLTYLQFAYSVDKGGIEAGEVFMNESPFTYRKMDENRANYTSDRVVEAATAGAAFAPIWGPVDPKVKPFDSGAVDSEGNKIYKNVKIVCTDTPTTGDPTTKVTYADYTTDSEGKYIIAAANFPASAEGHTYSNYKVAYVYDNIVIPQAKLPQIKAEMKSITLEARARRIAVTYSQIAA